MAASGVDYDGGYAGDLAKRVGGGEGKSRSNFL